MFGLENRGKYREWCARHSLLTAAVLLLLGGFVLYARSFGHQWTYDDIVVLVQNPDIRSWPEFFTDSYPGRPLRELSFMLDYQFFGLNPAGYHVQSIFWHGLNAVLLYILTLRLGGNRFAAWCAALLFLVHPLAVEVVANISHRKDSLALAFALLALLAYVEVFRDQRRRWGWFCCAVALAVTAYYGKQNTVMIWPLFLAYEALFVPREARLLLRFPRLLGAATVTAIAVAGVLRWPLVESLLRHRQWEIRGILSKFGYLGDGGEPVYLATIFKAMLLMLQKIVMPTGLGVEYDIAVPEGWTVGLIGAALIFFAGYATALWWTFRHLRGACFGLLWFGLLWLPTSGLWPLSYLLADRYLYAPLAGVFIVVGIVMGIFRERWSRPLTILLSAVVLVLAILTWQQNMVWRSPLSLWSQAVKVSPESSYALGFLGMVYIEQRQPRLALPLLRKAAQNRFNPEAKRALDYVERQLRFSR